MEKTEKESGVGAIKERERVCVCARAFKVQYCICNSQVGSNDNPTNSNITAKEKVMNMYERKISKRRDHFL